MISLGYIKMIRSILELAVPVWHPGISIGDSKKIERVQKCALSIILGRQMKSYEDTLKYLKLDTLSKRRENLMSEICLETRKEPKVYKLVCKEYRHTPEKSQKIY